MEHLIFQNDPYEMDWIRPDFPYAKAEEPKELSYESRSVPENDLIRTGIVIKNDSEKPYFTNQQEIRISFPFPDQYEDSTTSLIKRCRFIAEHQQCERDGMLKGAYLAYDNEENHLIYTPENDFNGGRERMGMGVLLSVYFFTKEEKYLEEGRRQVKILELFNGMQPDYHMNEAAIRHWYGYWFGKRRFYGDTFPHYWSALTGRVFQLYGEITQEETWLKRAEDSGRGVLPLFFRDDRASCAYVYPMLVNDRQAAFFDPYANDQDWGLYYNLGNCSE